MPTSRFFSVYFEAPLPKGRLEPSEHFVIVGHMMDGTKSTVKESLETR